VACYRVNYLKSGRVRYHNLVTYESMFEPTKLVPVIRYLVSLLRHKSRVMFSAYQVVMSYALLLPCDSDVSYVSEVLCM
jgi:hypothetical protein